MKQKRGAFDCFVEEKPLSHLDFRRQVVLSLLQTERTATPRAASGSMSQLFDIRFLVFILESGASFGWYIIGCAQLRNEFDKLNKQYTGRFNRTGPLESSN
ncbi:Guanine nucleotide exchange factor [Trichinella pseudospiralis]